MDKENIMIPYFAHEGMLARQERTIKRLWILCIILVVLLVGTNFAWIHYENQFEDIVTVTQESSTEGGGDAIVNNEGNIIYGEGKTDSH